jgi:hypothetical protein
MDNIVCYFMYSFSMPLLRVALLVVQYAYSSTVRARSSFGAGKRHLDFAPSSKAKFPKTHDIMYVYDHTVP